MGCCHKELKISFQYTWGQNYRSRKKRKEDKRKKKLKIISVVRRQIIQVRGKGSCSNSLLKTMMETKGLFSYHSPQVNGNDFHKQTWQRIQTLVHHECFLFPFPLCYLFYYVFSYCLKEVIFQAFRHLYVLATEARWVQTVDVDTGLPVYAPLEVTVRETEHYAETSFCEVSPCILPERAIVSS